MAPASPQPSPPSRPSKRWWIVIIAILLLGRWLWSSKQGEFPLSLPTTQAMAATPKEKPKKVRVVKKNPMAQVVASVELPQVQKRLPPSILVTEPAPPPEEPSAVMADQDAKEDLPRQEDTPSTFSVIVDVNVVEGIPGVGIGVDLTENLTATVVVSVDPANKRTSQIGVEPGLWYRQGVIAGIAYDVLNQDVKPGLGVELNPVLWLIGYLRFGKTTDGGLRLHVKF